MPKAKSKSQRARLYDFKENPVPEGSKVRFLTTPDGIRLRYAHWQASLRPSKGTVVILQGRAESIEKYFETVTDLRERGFGVLTFDWRGQGLSDRLLKDPKRGHIEHFDQYLVDLETILSEVALPDCKAPFYILGHSTGGLIALLAAPALGNRIRRMVLISPLMGLRNLPVSQKTVQRIGGFLSLIGLGRIPLSWGGRSLANRTFVGNNLTSDTGRFHRNGVVLKQAPDVAISSPTVSWMFAACRAMETVNTPGYSGMITIPTLLVAAGNDPIIAPEAIEKFGQKMRSGAFLTIFGAKHELLQERDTFREQLLSAFDAFVPGSELES